MGPLAFPGCEVGESVGDSVMGSCALETRGVDNMGAYLCPCAYEWAFCRGSRDSSPAAPSPGYPPLSVAHPAHSPGCVCNVLIPLFHGSRDLQNVAITVRVTLRFPRGRRKHWSSELFCAALVILAFLLTFRSLVHFKT